MAKAPTLRSSIEVKPAEKRESRKTSLRKLAADGIVERVAGWVAQDDHLTDLQRQWQQLETSLFAKAVAQKLDCQKALAGNSAEASAMRLLDAEITTGYGNLVAEAAKIRVLRASTAAAAFAKLELGLRVQGPFDWRDHARELIDDGIEELREILDRAGLLDQTSG